MPAWMTIDNDSTPDRLATALELILEGRAVACPGFSLAVSEGALRIDVEYSYDAPSDEEAHRLVATAIHNVDRLLVAEPTFHSALSPFPRQIALVWADGKAEVEIAKIGPDGVVWHKPRT